MGGMNATGATILQEGGGNYELRELHEKDREEEGQAEGHLSADYADDTDWEGRAGRVSR